MNAVRLPATGALLLLAACGRGPALEAHDAWIREPAPGAQALAGYVTLENRGSEARQCQAVQGADFGAAELHRTVMDGGQMRMLAGQVVDLPAGGTAALAPGGTHIMLFRPARGLRAGDTTTLTITCGADAVTTTFTVRRTD